MGGTNMHMGNVADEALGMALTLGGDNAVQEAPLDKRVAAAMAAANRALGIDLVTFVIHMVADSRFGRVMEGFSEEPMLTGALGIACVVGAQGALGLPPDAYILPPAAPALFKHLGAYGAPSGGLNGMRADVTAYSLRDTFMRPWRAVAAAGSRGLMPSHNSVLNCPAHANQELLAGLIRGEYNQTLALILSDTGDVAALAGFGLCTSDAQCAALALTAGVDVEQPPGTTFLALPAALAAGLATPADIDAAVARVLVHKFSSGLFDAPMVNASAADGVVNCAAHQALAREAVHASAVLLKNDKGVLPLRHVQRVVVNCVVFARMAPEAKAALNTLPTCHGWLEHIVADRTRTTHTNRKARAPPQTQQQYLVQWRPSLLERWALDAHLAMGYELAGNPNLSPWKN
jgi:beta-glucosidase-like glycosyl hydrolase